MFRTVDCAMWSDPWVGELPPIAKLLFVYLFTNPRTTACGACEISVRQIGFDLGIATPEVETTLLALSPKVEWWPEHQIVWVRNFYRRQAGNSNRDNYRKAALSALADMPSDVIEAAVDEYPDLEIPIPNPSPTHPQPIAKRSISFEEDKQEERIVKKNGEEGTQMGKRESGGETGTNGAAAPGVSEPATPVQAMYSPDFLEFWRQYPTGHGTKKVAFAEWQKLKPDAELGAAILAGLAKWHACDQWQRGFVIYAERFLKGRKWENEPPPAVVEARAPPNGRSPTKSRMRAEMDALLNIAREGYPDDHQ